MLATLVQRPWRWRVGFLLPRTLVACIVLDALLRFAPVGWRPMEVGESEVRHRVQGEAYPRNLHIESPTAYGDLARIGNLRELREYRSFSFTTDEHGFRKNGRGPGAAAVVFGDSFAQAGSDGKTLADQLAQIIGCDVFNAAGPDAPFRTPDAQLVTSITTRISLSNGYVIVETLERLIPQKPQESSFLRALVEDVFDLAVRRIPGVWRITRVMKNVRERAGSSPLTIIAERAFLVLQDDRILPNSYSGNVVKAHLSNGDWMLFYPDELATYEQRWPVDISYWTRVAPAFQKIGLTLVVVLVPNKYSVYHMLLADPPPVVVEPGELLQRAETQLRAAGIIAVNLTVLWSSRQRRVSSGASICTGVTTLTGMSAVWPSRPPRSLAGCRGCDGHVRQREGLPNGNIDGALIELLYEPAMTTEGILTQLAYVTRTAERTCTPSS